MQYRSAADLEFSRQAMNLMLTGGTGFFGKALLRRWLQSGAEECMPPFVTVLSRDPEHFLAQHPEFEGLGWLTFHRGDVLCPETLPSGKGYTHILHAATDSTLGPSLSPMQRYDQIVVGTRNMLDFAVANQTVRFLLTSSGGVYGPQPCDIQDFSEYYNGIPDPLDPRHAYGVAKRCAEHLCALYQEQHGIQTVIARCFAFVGPDLPRDVHFAIGNFIRDALVAPSIQVAGDGSPVRSYMDQRDLARWLLVLLECGRAGQAYNVGSDEAISIKELAYLVRDILAPAKEVQVLGDTSAASYRNRYVPAIDKARMELGLKLEFSLQDSLLNIARSSGVAAP